jgi:predicted Zn-dependent peptidase
MNSLLNNTLRIENGWTYGAYSRLSGGNSGSSAFLYCFASFEMSNMPNAASVMRDIVQRFCEEGITKEDFRIKRSNFELSMKVRMENTDSLLGMCHQTVLNGAETNFSDILKRSQELTHEEVNAVIKKHLKGKEFVHILIGDFKNNNVSM